MQSIKHEQVYFTKSEAAEYLRCSPRMIDYLREKKKLNSSRVGRKLLFTRSDLDALARGEEQQQCA
jgi:excisionase family DNA binding protein